MNPQVRNEFVFHQRSLCSHQYGPPNPPTSPNEPKPKPKEEVESKRRLIHLLKVNHLLVSKMPEETRKWMSNYLGLRPHHPLELRIKPCHHHQSHPYR